MTKPPSPSMPLPPTTTALGTPIPVRQRPRWGFHTHNELLHGRIAMMAFIALVALEWFLGRGFLTGP
jgi:hypothetical protein